MNQLPQEAEFSLYISEGINSAEIRPIIHTERSKAEYPIGFFRVDLETYDGHVKVWLGNILWSDRKLPVGKSRIIHSMPIIGSMVDPTQFINITRTV